MKTTEHETTQNTTNDLRHGFTVISPDGKEKTVIKIRLNDECKNGHEDFSLTADIYEKRRNGSWENMGGGCCHDHILKLRPELAPFAALHLSDWQGAPMHAAGNAFYWFAGFVEIPGEKYHGGSGSSGKSADECRRIFAEHIRADDAQIAEIVRQQPRTAEELQAVMEDMGFPQRWSNQADVAIAQLEAWTGKKFESKATRSQFKPLSAEARALIEERRASGYYSPEQVAARDVAAKAARQAKRIASIKADHEKAVSKLNRELAIDLALAEFFPDEANAIYYNHTDTLCFNWSKLDRLHTREEVEAFQTASAASLPAGLKIERLEKPKY